MALATLLATPALGQDVSEPVCERIEDEAVIAEAAQLSETHLRAQGFTVFADSVHIVLYCRDFFIYTTEYHEGVLGGVPYVFFAFDGTPLWVHYP